MSQKNSLITIATANRQHNLKGAKLMLTQRIFGTSLFAVLLVISTAVTQAQSKVWPRSGAATPPAPAQSLEHEPETASPQTQAAAQGGFLDPLERQKTAIVGSWLGTTGEGNKLIYTYNSDGTVHGSVQTEVSTNPEFGVFTPTHGVWQHLGGRQFGSTHLAILYHIQTGELLGYLKVRVVLTLNEAGDAMSGTDKVQILDPNGGVVETFPSSNTPYKRIKYEPFN